MALDKNWCHTSLTKNDEQRHSCRKLQAFGKYGIAESKVVLEIEHSVQKEIRGEHHLNKLIPAYISCYRSKGTWSKRSSRRENRFKVAPLAKSIKKGNFWGSSIRGALGRCILLFPFRPPGVIASALIGATVDGTYELN